MKRVILFVVGVAALILGLFPSVSFAQDWPYSPYIYAAEDSTKQRAEFQGTENYVFYYWYIPQTPIQNIRWKAEAQIRDAVNAAFQNWHNAVPELTFQEVAQGQDMEFFVAELDPWDPNANGMTIFTNFTYVATPNASYWTNAQILIDPGQWNQQALIGCIAHEIGHLLGLHERYGAACNAVEVTIMDAMLGKLQTCDGLQGPSALDEKRIYEFWAKGNMPITGAGCGTVGTWMWKDLSWAENRYSFGIWYWNGNGWTWYYGNEHLENVGTHFSYDNYRNLLEEVNRQTYGAPAGSHCACGHSYFPKFNTNGTWQCQSITLQ
ncbi:MAG: hypothetical protein FJ004_02605 [Chloroflexi bacterium]|nr:hypothetical protein [Chloroflexota bacterium]